MRPDENPVHKLCQQLGILFTVIDCGSGGDDGLGLTNIFPFTSIHAIEPRSDSTNPPINFYQGGRRISHDVALAPENGVKTLYVTRIPEASSLLRPCVKNVMRWRTDDALDVLEERQINCQTLEDFARIQQVTSCDLFKLDTQGTELDILLSGKDLVSKTGVILMEIEFVQLYEKQHLFGDVVGELSKLGFRFVNFLHGHSAGQDTRGYAPQKRIWCDTLFIRDDETVGISEAIRSGIILCELGYLIEARWFMEDRQVPEETIVKIMTAYKHLNLLKSGAFTRRVLYPFGVFIKRNVFFGRGPLIRIMSKFSFGRFLIQLLQRP